MPGHAVLLSIDQPYARLLDEPRLRALAESVLQAEGAAPCELSVTITDDETVRELNRRYAGEDAVTDVLSFSQREGEEFVAAPEGLPPLGDVVIAYPYAVRQASVRPEPVEGLRPLSQGWTVQYEIDWLLVHGVLHLLGYDHADPEEEQRMRARERELLDAVNG